MGSILNKTSLIEQELDLLLF